MMQAPIGFGCATLWPTLVGTPEVVPPPGLVPDGMIEIVVVTPAGTRCRIFVNPAMMDNHQFIGSKVEAALHKAQQVERQE